MRTTFSLKSSLVAFKIGRYARCGNRLRTLRISGAKVSNLTIQRIVVPQRAFANLMNIRFKAPAWGRIWLRMRGREKNLITWEEEEGTLAASLLMQVAASRKKRTKVLFITENDSREKQWWRSFRVSRFQNKISISVLWNRVPFKQNQQSLWYVV